MLIYDPALDLNHFVFRLIRIICEVNNTTIEFEKYRIIDFYLLFPAALSTFKMPAESFQSLKKIIETKQNKYSQPIDVNHQFQKIEIFQVAATRYLASINILDSDALEHGVLKKNIALIPEKLIEQLEVAKSVDDFLESFILETLLKISLLGSSGLKARSKLIEYKYDII